MSHARGDEWSHGLFGGYQCLGSTWNHEKNRAGSMYMQNSELERSTNFKWKFMDTYGKIIVLNEKHLGKLWKTMENYNFEWENYGTTIGKL